MWPQPCCAADELPFPESMAACDLSPLVADAITSRLSSVCLCGGSACKTRGSEALAATASPAAAASPFAALQLLKARAGAGKKGSRAGKARA